MKAIVNRLVYRLKTPPPEHWRRQLIKLLWLLLFPLALVMKEWAAANSPLIETHYSLGFYPVLSQAVSFLFGWMPFSAAEFLLYFGIAGLLAYIITQIVLIIIRRERLLRTFKLLTHLAMIISIGYFIFIALWGLNYYRQPLAKTLEYRVVPRSVSELKKLCVALTDETNKARIGLAEDSHGVTTLREGKSAMLRRIPSAYVKLSEEYPLFNAKYGPPKPVWQSHRMSYTETQGVFIPFTIEPNVNIEIPEAFLASTAAHEVAHQYGFAREDEANFVGYLACMSSEDDEMEYSGLLMALTTSMNALHGYDSDAYWEIYETYSDGIKRDLNSYQKYWKQFEGPVAETSSKMNNAYLKSNMQADGVNSYGRMVDLLLAQMAAKEEN